MVGGGAVPAAVVGLEGVMGPAHAGILVADHDALPGVAHGPHLGRVHVLHVPLDGAGDAVGRRCLGGTGGVVYAFEGAVGFEPGDVGTGGEGVYQGAVAGDDEHVGGPVGAVGSALGIE